MAFINEIVSDSDIDKYGLPFAKGSGRYWTRDKERDMYLWGGKRGNPAFGEDIEGVFELYIDGKAIQVAVKPGASSIKFAEQPFIVAWNKVVRIGPPDLHDLNREHIIRILKEALTSYGQDGELNKYTPDLRVEFGF